MTNDKILDNFRENLDKQCKRHGCNYKQLSELIGCDSSYISKVQNKRIIPSLDKIISIANYFGVEFIDLFK